MKPRFVRMDGAAARKARVAVEAIYRASYAEAIASGDPFEQPGPFMQRFDAYTRAPGLELVIAYNGGIPIAQTWGWPLQPTSRWWEGFVPDGPFDITEDGARTFALSEIMVAQHYTGRGLAHALHDELLSRRGESRSTLLVNPENVRAYRAYRRWGWRRVGTLTPAWPDAPTFDALILRLAGRASGSAVPATG